MVGLCAAGVCCARLRGADRARAMAGGRVRRLRTAVAKRLERLWATTGVEPASSLGDYLLFVRLDGESSAPPLIVPFLGVLWVGFLAAGLFTAWQMRLQDQNGPAWPGVLVAISLMASFVAGWRVDRGFLLAGRSGGVFADAVGDAAVVLPGGDGAAEHWQRPVCWPFGCLLVAAGSSEMGAAFVLAFALVQAVVLGVEGIRAIDGPGRAFTGVVVDDSGCALGLVMIAVGANRFHVVEAPTVLTSDTVGHPVMSLWRASGKLLQEIVGWRVQRERKDGAVGKAAGGVDAGGGRGHVLVAD